MKERESIESLKAALHYIDLAFLYDLVMEEEEFLKKVLQQFLKQFPGEMERLAKTVESGDARAIAALSHHIQSTVSVLGKNTPFFVQLENLEKIARPGVAIEDLKAVFKDLERHKELLMQDIDRLRTSLTG